MMLFWMCVLCHVFQPILVVSLGKSLCSGLPLSLGVLVLCLALVSCCCLLGSYRACGEVRNQAESGGGCVKPCKPGHHLFSDPTFLLQAAMHRACGEFVSAKGASSHQRLMAHPTQHSEEEGWAPSNLSAASDLSYLGLTITVCLLTNLTQKIKESRPWRNPEKSYWHRCVSPSNLRSSTQTLLFKSGNFYHKSIA